MALIFFFHFPSFHSILLIQDPDTQVGDFQRKLELINSRMTNDRQYRQVQHLGNCKYFTLEIHFPCK